MNNKEQIEQLMKMSEEERENLLNIMDGMNVDTTMLRSVLIAASAIETAEQLSNVTISEHIEETIWNETFGDVAVESESESESETISCITCDTEFEYVRKRGAKPRYCGDDCKPTYINRTRTYTCNECDEEFVMEGRGKLRLTCEPCALLPKIRVYTCDVCGLVGEQQGKGSLRKRHVECKLTSVPIVRTYTCDVCGKEGEQHGIGKSRKRCDGCKLVIKKVRTYECMECKNTFEMHGRGKLRMRCLECKPTVAPNTTPKTEEADSTESDNTELDAEAQMVLNIMKNLGIGQ